MSEMKDRMERDPRLGAGMSRFGRTPSTFLRDVAAGTSTKRQWNAFVNHYRDTLVAHAERRFHASHEDAQDTVQKVFVSLWGCPQTIRRHPNGRFRFWLVCVLRHHLANHWREQGRQQPESGPAGLEEVEDERSTFEAQARRACCAFAREDLYDQLRMGETPQTRIRRRTFQMWFERVFDGAGRDEVAAKYGVDPSTVTEAVKRVWEFVKANGDDLFADFQMV